MCTAYTQPDAPDFMGLVALCWQYSLLYLMLSLPLSLPEDLFELSGSCLLRCPENFFSEGGRCIPCDGPCPRGKSNLLETMATRVFTIPVILESVVGCHVGSWLLLWMDSLSLFPYSELLALGTHICGTAPYKVVWVVYDPVLLLQNARDFRAPRLWMALPLTSSGDAASSPLGGCTSVI